ncbi:unnamed protein product, partial [Mycena citricolor]
YHLLAPSMPPPQPTKAKAPAKKEKVFHPESRKAGQLARTAIRKGKLASLRTKRSKKDATHLTFYAFLKGALPHQRIESDSNPESDGLTLAQLHELARTWVSRHDATLAHEQNTRRAGRPKSPLQVRLEEQRLREEEIYRTGMDLPDLTHPPTLSHFRAWDLKSLAGTHLFRFARISSSQPEVLILAKTPTATAAQGDEDEAPDLLDPDHVMDET